MSDSSNYGKEKKNSIASFNKKVKSLSSVEPILEIINRLKEHNLHKYIENLVFEEYLIKMEPSSLLLEHGHIRVSDSFDSIGTTASKAYFSKASLGPSYGSGGHVFNKPESSKITNVFKLSLLNQRIAMEKEIFEKDNRNFEKEKNLYLSKLEEIQYRTNSTKISKELLEQYVKNYANPLTKRITGLKLIRFMQENVKEVENEIQKCCLLKLKFNRRLKEINLRLNLDENNRSLEQVDVDQIEIFNKELISIYNEKSEQIISVRQQLADISCKLKLYKHFVQEQMLQLKLFQDKIYKKQQEIGKLQQQQISVTKEIKKAKKTCTNIVEWQNRLPSHVNVSEYFRKSVELKELQQNIKCGKRRIQAQRTRIWILRTKLIKEKRNRRRLMKK